jgi:protocatechuate 3,4-dioxygenase beta subunit
MKRIAIAFLAILLLSASAQADQLILSRQVLLPDGKPAAGAKVFVWTYAQFNFPKVKPQNIETSTDSDGRYKVTIDDQAGMVGYMLIDSTGAALNLSPVRSPISSDTIWDSSDPIKLSPEYIVEGRALDQKGVPIADATVALAILYPESYTPMPLSPGDFQEVPNALKARTDRNGRYRFRGIGGFGSTIPETTKIEAYAKANWQGTHYLGEGIIELDPSVKTIGEPNLITMRATGEIDGRVIDGVSGKPIPGAQLDFSPNRLWTPASPLHIETDSKGRFHAKDMLAETQARVRKAGYPDTDVSFTRPTKDGVTMVLDPLVPFTGRLVDAETGGSPLVPTGLSITQERTLEEGATQISYGATANALGSSNDDAVFALEAPSGHVKLSFEDQLNTSSHPYDESQDFVVPAIGAKNVTISLHRQPGLMLKLDIDDPARAMLGNPKNDIDIEIERSGSPNVISAGYSSIGWFYPVDKWGETVTVHIKQWHKTSGPTYLIPPQQFVADPKIWPVTIKVPPAPAEQNISK